MRFRSVEGFADRGDRRLRYCSTGDGPPLLLLPGLGGGARMFGTLPRRFAKHGRRAITYDPVGVPPSSPLRGEFRFADAAADVVAVADAAGVDRIDLIGTSLGGKVALQAAAASPERVRRVALLASAAVVSARARRVYRFFEAVAGGIAPERFADVVTPFMFGRTFHVAHSGVIDDISRAMRPSPEVRALMVAQARALQGFDGRELAARVRAPALCAAGLEDTLTDAADVRATAECIPHGDYVEFEGAGHSLLLEHPGVFDAVDSFLGP